MGLFSGHTEVIRRYSVTRIKPDDKDADGNPILDSSGKPISFADDLWRNNKLRLNTSFIEGGIDEYSQTKWHMSHQIRKKYSSKYLNGIGVSVESDLKAYTFDYTKVANKVKSITGDSSLSVINIGEPADYGETSDLAAKHVAQINGNLTDIRGQLIQDSSIPDTERIWDIYSFAYVSGDISQSPILSGTNGPKVVEIYEEQAPVVPGSDLMTVSLNSRETYINTPYTNIHIDKLVGVMYYTDVISLISTYCNTDSNKWITGAGDHWWLHTDQHLAGTLDAGTLSSSITINEELKDQWLAGKPKEFTLTKTVTGTAKGAEDYDYTSTPSTSDGTCPDTPEDSTTTTVDDSDPDNIVTTTVDVKGFNKTTTIITVHKDYYKKPDTNTFSDRGISCNTTYSAKGDMTEKVVHKFNRTYTSGSYLVDTGKKDDDGNEIYTTQDTCTYSYVESKKTTFTCDNYVISVKINFGNAEFKPNQADLVIPSIISDYTYWLGMKDYVNDGSSYDFIYNDGFFDKTLIVTPSPDVTQILISPEVKQDLIRCKKSGADPFNIAPGKVFTSSAMTNTIKMVLPVRCVNSQGTTITVELLITEDLYSDKTEYPLTPIIPLKNNTKTDTVFYYQYSAVAKAKAWLSKYLNNLVQPDIQYTANDENYISNQDAIDLKNEIRDALQGTTDNTIDSIDKILTELDNINSITKQVRKYTLGDTGSETYEVLSDNANLNWLIDHYEDPVTTTIQTLKDKVNTFTDENMDRSSREIRRVFKTFGLPKQGIDSLMTSLEPSQVYSASAIVGLQLFNSDGTLFQTKTAAKARLMYMFAELLTGQGTVLGTEQTLHLTADNLNVSYRYSIIKSHIEGFKLTPEYTESLNNGRAYNYLIRVKREISGSYKIAEGHGRFRTEDLYTYNVYVYRLQPDGSAICYKFTEIAITYNALDGHYTLSTKETKKQITFNNDKQGGTDLDQLILLYPDDLNRKLTFHEYSMIYSDNLFLFVYTRQSVKVKWYQCGFFGFVLTIAGIVAVIIGTISGQYWLVMLGSTAINMGLGLMFPKMNPYVRTALAMTLTYAAGSLSDPTPAPMGPPVAPTLSNAIAGIEAELANISASTWVSSISNVMSQAYQYELQQESKHIVDKYEKQFTSLKNKTEELMTKLTHMDNQAERTKIIAQYLQDIAEEGTDSTDMPAMYYDHSFDADMLQYMSGIDCQASAAKDMMANNLINLMLPLTEIAPPKMPN